MLGFLEQLSSGQRHGFDELGKSSQRFPFEQVPDSFNTSTATEVRDVRCLEDQRWLRRWECVPVGHGRTVRRSDMAKFHQAKEMQRPLSSRPRANRFPAKRQGGLGTFRCHSGDRHR